MEEALKIAANNRLDFVISDIGLPDRNGNYLMRELKESYGLRGLALTGYEMEQDVELGKRSGFEVYLAKPVTIQFWKKPFSSSPCRRWQRTRVTTGGIPNVSKTRRNLPNIPFFHSQKVPRCF